MLIKTGSCGPCAAVVSAFHEACSFPPDALASGSAPGSIMHLTTLLTNFTAHLAALGDLLAFTSAPKSRTL